MVQERNLNSTGLFRTQAWANAWLDTWGKDKRLELFDLGGRGNPREMLYRISARLKGIIPVDALHLVGVGSSIISTPRAEYNDIDALLAAAGEAQALCSELKKIAWNQFVISDIDDTSASLQQLERQLICESWHLHELNRESAYYVKAESVNDYLAGLGANTRLRYFNRRERLSAIGDIEFTEFSLAQAPDFFALLNQFHLQRWASACYSPESQAFLRNFMERLTAEGGHAIMQAMLVNGEVVSVIFDIIYSGCRYNLQSGYSENKFPKIALGAIHMGYAIESAIASGLLYDFMAGHGKNTNYKQHIATHKSFVRSLSVERGWVKYLRKLKNY